MSPGENILIGLAFWILADVAPMAHHPDDPHKRGLVHGALTFHGTLILLVGIFRLWTGK